MTDVTAEDVHALDPWFQRFEFPGGVTVGGWPTDRKLEELLRPLGLPEGMTAIDVGCMSGAGMLWLERRGFEVWGCDIHPRCAGQFRLVKRAFGMRAQYRDLSIYDLDAEADVVVMLGVYYHLQHPLLGIQKAWEATKKLLVLEGEVNAKAGCSADFHRGEYKGDGSNWWVPTLDCLHDWCGSLPGIRAIEMIHPLLSECRAGVRVWR
jgi:hypothetical protein